MTTVEWISVIALIIATGGFAINLYNWFFSGPRVGLSVMPEAIVIPDDGKGTRLNLTVYNRGTAPTMLTHFVAFVYPSRWAKFRKRSAHAGIINSPGIPSRLDINTYWMGQMFYRKELTEARDKGHLYVGVIASHRSKSYLIRVPTPKQIEAPKEQIASGQ